MLRESGLSDPPHNMLSFLDMTLTLHFCNSTENLFLQKSRNPAALGFPASSDEKAASFCKKFLASPPHDPKCSIASGTTLTTEHPGRLCCSYLDIFLVSLRLAATPVASAEHGKTSELQGCVNEMSRSILAPDPASNMIMSGLHSELVYLFLGSRQW